MVPVTTTFFPSGVLHDILVLGIKFFAVITTIQIVVMIVHKLVLELRNRRRMLLKTDYLSQMYRSFRQEDVSIRRPRTMIEHEALADVCIYLMSRSLPEQVARIQQTVRRFGIPRLFVVRFARSRSWITRYRTIEKLGFLRLPELGATYRTVLESKKESRQVHSKVVWALSLICREDDLPIILESISAPDFMSAKFNEYIFCNIIGAFRGRGEAEALLDRFARIMEDEGVPLLLKRDFIQACGESCFGAAEGLILRCAERFGGSPEMRIACVRAIQGTGGEMLEEMVIAGLKDTDWRVRAVAAKDVEKCSDAIMAFLDLALGDPNYYVRLNAALSLACRGETGLALLRAKSQSSDRFIRDISQYVLAA